MKTKLTIFLVVFLGVVWLSAVRQTIVAYGSEVAPFNIFMSWWCTIISASVYELVCVDFIRKEVRRCFLLAGFAAIMGVNAFAIRILM